VGQRLKCQDPHIVQRYNNYLRQALEEARSLQQLKEIYQEGVMALKTSQIDKLEQLDQYIMKAKQEAE